jgi:hypothetical protein
MSSGDMGGTAFLLIRCGVPEDVGLAVLAEEEVGESISGRGVEVSSLAAAGTSKANGDFSNSGVCDLALLEDSLCRSPSPWRVPCRDPK